MPRGGRREECKLICAFSGHRPARLPWRYQEDAPQCAAVKQLLFETVQALAAEGYDRFLCGMAQGADWYFAEAVLRLRQQRQDVALHAVLPHGQQDARWCAEEQTRYRALLAQCQKVVVLQRDYTPDSYHQRNRYLVEHSDLLMTLYDGGSGGTAYTVRYAAQQGRQILPLWL